MKTGKQIDLIAGILSFLLIFLEAKVTGQLK